MTRAEVLDVVFTYGIPVIWEDDLNAPTDDGEEHIAWVVELNTGFPGSSCEIQIDADGDTHLIYRKSPDSSPEVFAVPDATKLVRLLGSRVAFGCVRVAQ